MGRYGRITGEIKESMTSFLKIDFVHQRREFNKEAHKLARSPIHDSVGRHVWFCNPPEDVLFDYFYSSMSCFLPLKKIRMGTITRAKNKMLISPTYPIIIII